MAGKRKQDEAVDDPAARKKIKMVVVGTPSTTAFTLEAMHFKSTRGEVNIARLQPAAGSTVLFRLPRELRDKIYHELWKDGPLIKQRYGRIKYDVTYGLPVDGEWAAASYKHSWLLTSKQILHEGIHQLHTRSIWHMFDYHERKTKRVNYIFPLLTPGCAQDVSIHLNAMRSNLNINVKTAHGMISKLIADPNASALQSIRVSLYCNGGPFGFSHKPFYCDFSPLERLQELKNLEQLAIIIEGERHRGAPHWDHLRFEHNAHHPTYDQLWADIKRLATLLIPNHKHKTAMVNSIRTSKVPSERRLVYARSVFRFITRDYYFRDGARFPAIPQARRAPQI